jgi:stage V sporulation protein G
MEITEAKIKLMPARSDRLQAFCTVTIDNDFVIRDIKIIEGAKGAFVAMPSRKLTDKCSKCSGKNHLRARFCNDCGARLDESRATKDKRGRAKLHADIAHPINSACRERLQAKILEAFHAEVERSKQPGYVPPKLDEDEDVTSDLEEMHEEKQEAPRESAPPPAPPAAPEPRPEPPPKPQPEPEPEPEPEPAPNEEEDEDLRRLEEEVRRYEEAEKREAEKRGKGEKKDDFASGIL